MRLTLMVAVLCCTASPVLAEQMLYCTDTDATGFSWPQKGKPRTAKFNPERHTIKVVSDTERIITRMVGDTAGSTDRYTCQLYLDRAISCNDGSGNRPWVFYRNTYSRAFLGGPPAGGGDQNTSIAYGICTKF